MKIMLWQRHDEPSMEYLRFEQDEHGILFDGTIVLDLDGESARIDYFVECTTDWKTRRVSIVQERARVTSKLNLTVDDEQHWYRDGKLLDQFTGLTNIDLSVTPATNLLALRTMTLELGKAEDTSAVWVLFPELELKQLDQRYKKIDDTHYEYEAKAVDFEAILETDDFGFITKYGDLWQVIRSS